MRYILIILVFLSIGANAQMVIKAHPNYRPFAVAANLLLDDYPNAEAAYSLRKLDKDYTGAAIRVRKDTTGQPEQDIGFTALGDLDTAAIKTFLNARSGFVVTWYDQSGNARNTTQATQANQPRIANLGVIDRVNGDIVLAFDGSNDILTHPTLGTFITGQDKTISLITVLKHDATTADRASLGFGDSVTTASIARITMRGGNAQWYLRDAGLGIYTADFEASNTDQKLYGIYYNGSLTQITLSSNNSIVVNAQAFNYGNAVFNRFAIGGLLRTTAGLQTDVNFSEIIMYSTFELSNRNGIESNINSYYGIY
jgi:hypothetical protein